ncbi:MAG: hypothetical protein RI568_07790 [Natronomonas sp.]|uniref:hypothetical protein n=1 Tax=Natronomonas sp. TaxID=2184060 RepID=UPI0028707353|nr:hypothetical protein [Natronomonas sp.]MDR9430587.1 hypothetical protein [Natronomonas sp.]
MSANGVILYFTFGTLLFFFWVYGIVSFISDLRRQIIPWIRVQWRNRRDDETNDRETEGLSELYGDPDDE